MIDNPDGIGAAGYGLTAVGVLLTMVVGWFLNRKKDNAQTDAVISDATGKTNLIEALEKRIESGEKRLNEQTIQIAELFKRIDAEIILRHAAQEQNLKLRLRVTELEHAIRQMGGTVPVAA